MGRGGRGVPQRSQERKGARPSEDLKPGRESHQDFNTLLCLLFSNHLLFFFWLQNSFVHCLHSTCYLHLRCLASCHAWLTVSLSQFHITREEMWWPQVSLTVQSKSRRSGGNMAQIWLLMGGPTLYPHGGRQGHSQRRGYGSRTEWAPKYCQL